jgi:hypothetical protein
MASTATIMKELFQEFSSNLNTKLDLILNLNDEVNANPANLNATLTRIESAHPKEDTANDFINGWTRKFQEFFDRRNTSPSATDPIPLETNTPQNSNTIAMTQAKLNLDTAVDNLAVETQQVMIADDNLLAETEHIMIYLGKPEEPLPDAAKPLLLDAPCSDQAANNVAVNPFSNNFTTKLMDNDASLSNSDIHKVIDTWKKSEEFFALQMSPTIAAPSSQLSQSVAISKLLLGEISTAPTSTLATPAQVAPQTLPQ